MAIGFLLMILSFFLAVSSTFSFSVLLKSGGVGSLFSSSAMFWAYSCFCYSCSTIFFFMVFMALNIFLFMNFFFLVIRLSSHFLKITTPKLLPYLIIKFSKICKKTEIHSFFSSLFLYIRF